MLFILHYCMTYKIIFDSFNIWWSIKHNIFNFPIVFINIMVTGWKLIKRFWLCARQQLRKSLEVLMIYLMSWQILWLISFTGHLNCLLNGPNPWQKMLIKILTKNTGFPGSRIRAYKLYSKDNIILWWNFAK